MPNSNSAKMPLKEPWHGLRRAPIQEWTDMNCTVISANSFSALSWIISRISPVQSAVSVRKSTLYRPFIFPILNGNLQFRESFLMCYGEHCIGNSALQAADMPGQKCREAPASTGNSSYKTTFPLLPGRHMFLLNKDCCRACPARAQNAVK